MKAVHNALYTGLGLHFGDFALCLPWFDASLLVDVPSELMTLDSKDTIATLAKQNSKLGAFMQGLLSIRNDTVPRSLVCTTDEGSGSRSMMAYLQHCDLLLLWVKDPCHRLWNDVHAGLRSASVFSSYILMVVAISVRQIASFGCDCDGQIELQAEGQNASKKKVALQFISASQKKLKMPKYFDFGLQLDVPPIFWGKMAAIVVWRLIIFNALRLALSVTQVAMNCLHGPWKTKSFFTEFRSKVTDMVASMDCNDPWLVDLWPRILLDHAGSSSTPYTHFANDYSGRQAWLTWIAQQKPMMTLGYKLRNHVPGGISEDRPKWTNQLSTNVCSTCLVFL